MVFIQRTDILNSGNVPLALSFGRVVTGPDSGNIGGLLAETGNPAFDPADPRSVDIALERAARLSATDKAPATAPMRRNTSASDASPQCTAGFTNDFMTENDNKQPHTVGRQLASGVFYTSIAKYAVIVVTLVVSGVLARLFTPKSSAW